MGVRGSVERHSNCKCMSLEPVKALYTLEMLTSMHVHEPEHLFVDSSPDHIR